MLQYPRRLLLTVNQTFAAVAVGLGPDGAACPSKEPDFALMSNCVGHVLQVHADMKEDSIDILFNT